MAEALLEQPVAGQAGQPAGSPGAAGQPDFSQWDFESQLDDLENEPAIEPESLSGQAAPPSPAEPLKQSTAAPPGAAASTATDDAARRTVPNEEPPGGNVAPQEAWPAELLQEFGLTEQDAQSHFGNVEALQNAIRLRDIQIRNMGRQRMAAMQQPVAGQPQGTPYQPLPQQQRQQPFGGQPQQPVQQQPANAAGADEEFAMPPGDWDDDTVKLVRQMDAHYRRLLDQKLRQTVEPIAMGTEMLARQQAAQADQQYWLEFHAAVRDLPPEYQEVFGDVTQPLVLNSPQHRNLATINQVIQQAHVDRRQAGLPPLSIRQLVSRMAAVEFPQVQQRAAEAKTRGQIGQRQSQFTSRPTARIGAKGDAVSRAAQYATEALRQRGVVSNRRDDQDDGLGPGEF